MDGLTATRVIRDLEATAGVRAPIIAVTAYAMPGDREKCISAGMDDYMAKPVQSTKLKEILENWLSLS